MSDELTLKDSHTEMRIYSTRVVAAIVLVVLCLLIILGRYFSLQVVQHQSYVTESEKNRVHVQAIPPKRGLISDRNGVLLAENKPTYTLNLVKERSTDYKQTLALIAQSFALSDKTLSKLDKQLRRSRPFEPVPLKFNLNDEDIAWLAVNQHELPGVEVAAQLARYYPQSELYAHVIGYTGRINERETKRIDTDNYNGTHHIGKIGLERFYEDILHGQVGYQNVEVNAYGRVIRVLNSDHSEPGSNLQLYLDDSVQRAAYEALGDYRGAIVAIEIATGGVLAMASTPSFDANQFVSGVSSKQYSAWRDSPDLPLFNRAIQGQYPPGSTVKPIYALAGLYNDVVDASFTVKDPGFFKLPNDSRLYRDWKKWGHGKNIDLRQAIKQSCDVYFYDLAHRMGIDMLSQFGSQFGFGLKTGIDIPSERAGIMPSREWKRRKRGQAWFPGETLSAGIGQGYTLATPLQLAVATATLASKGQRKTPRLVQAINGKPHIVAPLSPIEVKRESDWNQVFSAMESVVHERRGTANGISKGLLYKIAGKTGTAQVVGIAQGEEYDASKLNERNRDHALFMGFAPADNPLVAVIAVAENGEHGSSTAAPMVRKVMDAFLLPLLNKAEAGDKSKSE